jgi:hypothetical protein
LTLENLDVGRTIVVCIRTLGAGSFAINIRARSLSGSAYQNVSMSNTSGGVNNGISAKPLIAAWLSVTCFARDLYFYGFILV